MTAYSWEPSHRAWTKECPCCQKVVVGENDEAKSVTIFATYFHECNNTRSSQDGFQSHCIECKEIERLKRKYGSVNLEGLFLAQKGKCGICEKELHLLTKGKGDQSRACIDHDHNTGAVRGLLCRGCNSAIGRLGDSLEMLLKAVAYLKKALVVKLNQPAAVEPPSAGAVDRDGVSGEAPSLPQRRLA